MSENTIPNTAHCLRRNKEKILTLWAERARQEIPPATNKSTLVLRDALPHFLNSLIRTLSPTEYENEEHIKAVSREHGQQRAEQFDYSLDQVLAEYFILQKTILEVLEVESGIPLTASLRDSVLEFIAIGIKQAGNEFARRQIEHLKRSNEALQSFGQIASHDLQEPLRMIASHLGLLQRKIGKLLTEELQGHFNYAIDGARRMKSLIDSLLIYSQIGKSDDEVVLTDFNLSLKHAISNLEAAIKENHSQITFDPLPQLLARPVEIERLFQNLIGNAIKFRSPRPPTIHISAVKIQKHWLFSIFDNGIGVLPGDENRIFELFTRVHSKDLYPGSGIGLSACRKVVELHHGTIWYESNPDGGSIFKFTIPEFPPYAVT